MEELYIKIKSHENFFRPCFKAIITAAKLTNNFSPLDLDKYLDKDIDNDPKNTSEQDIINKKENEKDQKEIEKAKTIITDFEAKDEKIPKEEKLEICQSTKVLIEKIFNTAVDQNLAKNSLFYKNSFITYVNTKMKNEDYCKYPLITKAYKAHKLIEANFESKEEYFNMCMSIKNSDSCINFPTDNKGIWYFIKQTLKFTLFVKNCGLCLFRLMRAGGEDFNSTTPIIGDIKEIAGTILGNKNLTKAILKEFTLFVLHNFSFGALGKVRAVYNMTQLAYKMANFLNIMFNLPFEIGKLVGQGIKIFKAFTLGRRRRK
jgi:hypothetical protein